MEAARVRDVLVQLRGLVVRGAPGTPEEHVGVFHTTFAEYLRTDAEAGIDEQAAHAALADAIADPAPRLTATSAARCTATRRPRRPSTCGPLAGG